MAEDQGEIHPDPAGGNYIITLAPPGKGGLHENLVLLGRREIDLLDRYGPTVLSHDCRFHFHGLSSYVPSFIFLLTSSLGHFLSRSPHLTGQPAPTSAWRALVAYMRRVPITWG